MKTLSNLKYWSLVIAILVCCMDTVSGQGNQFVVGPTSLTFNTPQGLSPAPQSVNVSTTLNSVNFTIDTTGGINCPLSYQLQSSVTPSTVTIGVQSGSLPAGTYNCGTVFSAQGLTPVTVPSTIVVGTGGGIGSLSVNPASLSLNAQVGSIPVNSTLTLGNSNTGTTVQYTASATSSGWLQITPTAGSVGTTSQIQVQANPSGLAAGVYQGKITIAPSGGTPTEVNVTLTVSGNPTLQIQQGGSLLGAINFAFQTGTALPNLQTINFSSSNPNAPLQFSVSPSGGGNFLVISPSGSLATPQSVNLSIASTAATLAPGTYNASVNVSAPGAANPTTTIPVTFVVSSTPLLTIGTPPSTFNFQIGGSNPANQTVQIGSTSTAIPITVATNLPLGQNWLMVGISSNTASAAAPAILTLSVVPGSLPPGTYSGTVTVNGAGAGNSPLTFPVTLVVSNSTLLNATPSSITLSFQTNGAPPPAQPITVTTTGAPLAYNVQVATSSCGANFLTVSQATGNTGTSGSTFSVSANPAGITAPQTCMGTITISSVGAPNAVTIPVTLLVSATSLLNVSQGSLNFTGQVGSGITLSQNLALTTTDGSTPVQYTILNQAPWLTVTPTFGNTPANIQVTANTSSAGLQIGQNTTTLTLTSPSLPPGASISIPVTLTLTSAATISLDKTSLAFTQPSGGQAPASQNVNINVIGGTASNAFNATASVQFGNWLTVTPTSGAVPGAITVTANGANLSQGVYTGQVQVNVTGAANTPRVIPVTLTVTAPQSLAVSSGTLTFNTQVGASQPPSNQIFQVTSIGGPVAFNVGTTATTCPGFLSATPASGTTPGNVTVSINNVNLQAGTCAGTITISSPGLASQIVAVNLTVGAPSAPAINSIVNGASFIPGPIAPGEIVTIFGSNLGPATLVTFILNPNNTFATALAGTEVLFDNVLAPILFVRNDQIAVIVPFEVAGRVQVNVQIRRSNQLSNTLQQRLDETAPGIFTVPSGGTGQGAIVNQNGTVNGPGATAAKGSVVSLYITGAGQTNPTGLTGALNGTNPLNLINAPVSVTIGGLPATVEYKGGAPGNVQGLYQINVTVPTDASLPSGNQPIQITVGGRPTQSGVTIFIQ